MNNRCALVALLACSLSHLSACKKTTKSQFSLKDGEIGSVQKFSAADEPKEMYIKREANEGTYQHPSQGDKACANCHQNQFQQWAMSNHAYAMKDPVFHAMHRLGTKETNGGLMKLGFCVQCHAYGAFKEDKHKTALTKFRVGDEQLTDLDLNKLRSSDLEGVHCDICHSIVKNNASFNARMDAPAFGVRNGSLTAEQLTQKPPHPVRVPLGNNGKPLFSQSEVCGPCHAVNNPKGAPIEETFQEYGVYARLAKQKLANGESLIALGKPVNQVPTCQTCHMPESVGMIAKCKNQSSPLCKQSQASRPIHDHTFVGVDVSLLPPEQFPGYTTLRKRVADLLAGAATVDAKFDSAKQTIDVSITNQTGHAFPSGATAERQLWLEVKVFSKSTNKLVWHSGTVDQNGDLRDTIEGHSLNPGSDPQLIKYGQDMIKVIGDQGVRMNIEKRGRNKCQVTKNKNVHADIATFPWAALDVCNYLLMPFETNRHQYALSESSKESSSGLKPGSYYATVALVFRSFPPYFLKKLELKAGLDPDVRGRLMRDTGTYNLTIANQKNEGPSNTSRRVAKAFLVDQIKKLDIVIR